MPNTVTSGSLLIAHPTLLESNFKRVVIFLAEHSDEGTLGYVLNRRLETTLSQILPDEPSALSTLASAIPLYWGGPCQTDTLHCVHRLGTHIPGAVEVTKGVYWGGSFDVLYDLIAHGAIVSNDVRFFVGYAGWGSGQLDGEIGEQSWLLQHDSADVVFAETTKNMWTRSVRSLGGDYIVLGNTPEHPSLN